MKRRFLTLALAFTFMSSIALVSCSKSNQDLINDYRKLCKEAVEAQKSGDLSKIQSLTEKATKLEKELEKRELTDEEKAEMAKIALETMSESLNQ